MKKRLLTLALFSFGVSLIRADSPAPLLRFTPPADVFARGRVSSEFSEIRVALSPDGTRVLWGSTNRPGGPGGWDLWESRKEGAAWSAPSAVPFCSPQNARNHTRKEYIAVRSAATRAPPQNQGVLNGDE